MADSTFVCPKCKTVLQVEPGTSDLAAACPNCASVLTAHFFPAFYRTRELGTSAVLLTDHTEASCFYHPQKQAARVCDGCGRLICSLCSVEIGQEHLCPNCISSGKKKGKLAILENTRTRYDQVALSLAVLGIFLSIFSFMTAPAAIYVAIRYWNAPRSLLGGGRGRFVVAILIALFTLFLWGGIFGVALLEGSHRHHR